MLWLAVTDLAKEFDTHSRYGSIVLVEFFNFNVGTPLTLKKKSNDIHRFIYELVLNCALI